MDNVDVLTLVIQEMSKEFPTLMETLVHERDQFVFFFHIYLYLNFIFVLLSSRNHVIVFTLQKCLFFLRGKMKV